MNAADDTFMEAVDSSILDELRARGRMRFYARGNVLFHESQSSDHVAVLVQGTVKVTVADGEGRQSLLAIRGPGDLIGELGAIEGKPRFGTATALEAVEALVVPATVFREVVAERPSAAGLVIQMLGSRLRDSDRKRAEFGTRGSGARVAARILELADRFGVHDEDGIRIDLPLTQDEIALWAGCSREAVAKVMQTMRELQWVKTGRRSIVIVDDQALRDWSLSN